MGASRSTTGEGCSGGDDGDDPTLITPRQPRTRPRARVDRSRPEASAEVLAVRPISGSEEDKTLIHGRRSSPSRSNDACFPSPSITQQAGHDAALLLRDALLLSLRRGAGPFRSFGQIAVEPRAYQLVPLLMALKLDPVRLLIADDVGVGKTIEAGLIARELLDRGDIERFAVLCPPHLVDQWVSELERDSTFGAVAVTAASAARLERSLRPSESIFRAHPYTVVSLDYIKSDARRTSSSAPAPNFVIVDEAHTCAATGQGRHQRYELLRAWLRGEDAASGPSHRHAAQRGRGRVLSAARTPRPRVRELEHVTGDEHGKAPRATRAALRPAAPPRHLQSGRKAACSRGARQRS